MSELMVKRTSAGGFETYLPGTTSGEFFWGFTCRSRQNYADTAPLDCVDEIMLGIQCVQGGCLCELALRWHMNNGSPVPRLEVYSDAWAILQSPVFTAVMEQLTEMRLISEPTPDAVSALLIAYGFKDQSDRPLGDSCEAWPPAKT